MKKHIQITLDFTVTIEEEKILPGQNKDECEYNERQKRLLHAVLSDKERFDTYLQWQITGFFECMNWHDWYEQLMGDRDITSETILSDSIATLDTSDQRFFEEVKQEDIFHENIEDMENCFTTELDKVEYVVSDEVK